MLDSFPIPHLIDIPWKKMTDDRGSFQRLFSIADLPGSLDFSESVQSNMSFSPLAFTLRGLHFQSKPFQEHKLITCVSGAIYDVCVDIRPKSPNFGKVYTFKFDSSKSNLLSVPYGFAHGFQTLTENTMIVYFVNQVYNQQYEHSLRFDSLDVSWPSDPSVISEKDRLAKSFDQLLSDGVLL